MVLEVEMNQICDTHPYCCGNLFNRSQARHRRQTRRFFFQPPAFFPLSHQLHADLKSNISSGSLWLLSLGRVPVTVELRQHKYERK